MLPERPKEKEGRVCCSISLSGQSIQKLYACKKDVPISPSKKSRLRCTLLLLWEEGYEHAWAVITDLVPERARVACYGLRAWSEAGFKDVKRGGFGWHHSKMQDAR